MPSGTASRLHARFFLQLEDPPRSLRPAMCDRTLPAHREDCTICFFLPLLNMAEKLRHTSYTTQRTSLHKAICSCTPSYLHGHQPGSLKDRSMFVLRVIVRSLDSHCLSNCSVPRHSLVHTKLSQVLTLSRTSCTSCGSSTSPLRCL